MLIKNYINNFCNLIYIYNTVDVKTIDKVDVLSKADLLTKQAISSIQEINGNHKKLVDFTEYYRYRVKQLTEDNNLKEKIIILKVQTAKQEVVKIQVLKNQMLRTQ